MICHQHIIREAERSSQLWEQCPSVRDCLFHEIPRSVAAPFLLRYEWIGNMGTSRRFFALSWSESPVCVVAIGACVAPSKAVALLREHGLVVEQFTRGASSPAAPRNSGSHLIRRVARHYASTGIPHAFWGYADPRAGEVGTIYQACNALYLGMTDPGRAKIYRINGRRYDPRKVHHKFGSRAHKHLLTIDPEYTTEPIAKKHRYLLLACDRATEERLRTRLKCSTLPYPKRMP